VNDGVVDIIIETVEKVQIHHLCEFYI